MATGMSSAAPSDLAAIHSAISASPAPPCRNVRSSLLAPPSLTTQT